MDLLESLRDHTDPLDLKVCNCGRCGRPLLSRRHRALYSTKEYLRRVYPAGIVAGHYRDGVRLAPICRDCTKNASPYHPAARA